MQLSEQGKLDIDADVNNYLDFKIAPAFGKPITLRNLMTHTGGFEEVLHDILIVDPKKTASLRDFLINNQPRRMYPPGEIPARRLHRPARQPRTLRAICFRAHFPAARHEALQL
jgi:CubicO group peptidase (beta-lactamase class C family)